MRVCVCIPTYNELENIELIVGRVRSAVPAADVLVLDDNSPDGTGRLADDMAARDAQVHVMHRTEKAGLGAAYVAGFGWALEHGYDVVVEMDADGSHQPEQLPRLLAGIEDGADLVLGSRYVPGGDVVNWPAHRLLLSRGGNAYTRFMLRLPLRDATGGYRAYRATLLRKLDLGAIASEGYCFQVDLAWQAYSLGASVVEVPITFIERERGESKMSQAIVVEALWRVTVWGVNRRKTKASKAPKGRSRP